MSQELQNRFSENTTKCFQCAKCSTGCPVAEEMDLLPHQVIHAVAINAFDEVLTSGTIWTCAGCYTCAIRCPNDINITSVMDTLRQIAIETDQPCPREEVKKFHESFLADLKRRGRVHELRFMAEYNLRLGKPFNNMEVAPKMVMKRRLKLLPPKAIKGFKSWSKDIWN